MIGELAHHVAEIARLDGELAAAHRHGEDLAKQLAAKLEELTRVRAEADRFAAAFNERGERLVEMQDATMKASKLALAGVCSEIRDQLDTEKAVTDENDKVDVAYFHGYRAACKALLRKLEPANEETEEEPAKVVCDIPLDGVSP